MYRTSIFATFQVAEHICNLKIDNAILRGEPGLVNDIAEVRIGQKTRINYSFASKYCAWHNPSKYPIFDRYVGQMLWEYSKRDKFDKFFQYDLWKYPRFKLAMENFRSFYDLDSFSFKDLDKFLWLAGKELFSTTTKAGLSGDYG